ncbi:MAG: hypothetical protein R3343_06950 [Nitriliruptorales bacterium]|nr:hypothetical protein [Nitriliruptorales bacterium]
MRSPRRLLLVSLIASLALFGAACEANDATVDTPAPTGTEGTAPLEGPAGTAPASPTETSSP